MLGEKSEVPDVSELCAHGSSAYESPSIEVLHIRYLVPKSQAEHKSVATLGSASSRRHAGAV